MIDDVKVGVEVKVEKHDNVNKVQVPYERDDGRKKLKKTTDDRRDELILLINDLGFFRARRLAKSLAEKYKISFQQIYQDFDWIKGHVKPEDLREVKIDLKIGRSKAHSMALQMLNDAKTSKEKSEAISAVIMSGKHYREELEAWGEKEKIADKHQIKIESEFTKEEREEEIKRLLGK